jgi:hypothetical protein
MGPTFNLNGVIMRFLTITFVAFLAFLAFLPLTAMAGDRVTLEDIGDVYEYVDAMAIGNSCKAETKDGSSSCAITCVDWENAHCMATETTATCLCLGASPKPIKPGGLEAY